MKKKFKSLLIFIGILCIIIISISGCNNTSTNKNNDIEAENSTGGNGSLISPDKNMNPGTQDFESITISSDGQFEENDCEKRNLSGKIIMIESKYCGHCQKALPIFKSSCEESGIEPIIIDISESQARKQLEEFGIDVRFTPTFIFDCKYFIGSKTKAEYLAMLNK